MFKSLKQLFDLRHDQGDYDAIDGAIRDGVRIGGTNLWVLIFAILIASVGLNVNSTAVIIGAMLISPLMRPILGIGYGAAVSDFRLIRSAARSLLIFAALSMVTSTCYFLLSPLSQAQSELLARTTPTLWDVLIAFFGGCAGIVAQTRKGESTVIPGAAIATALMPPLCTAGYALASHNWDFLWGAAYLFLINAFFIALATFLFVKLMGFPEHEEADPVLRRRAHFAIALGVVALAVPSAFLAYGLVKDQLFIGAGKQLQRALAGQPGAIVLTQEVAVRERRIDITLGGAALPPEAETALRASLRSAGFPNATLRLRHVGQERIDLGALRDQLRSDLYASTMNQLEDRSSKVDALTLELAKQQQAMARQREIIAETLAQYPAIERMAVADGSVAGRAAESAVPALVVVLHASPRLDESELERIRAGLRVRLPTLQLELVQSSLPQPAEGKRRRQRQ